MDLKELVNEHSNHPNLDLNTYTVLVLREAFKVMSSEWYTRNDQNHDNPPKDPLQARFNSGLLAGINICCNKLWVLEESLKEQNEDRTGSKTMQNLPPNF